MNALNPVANNLRTLPTRSHFPKGSMKAKPRTSQTQTRRDAETLKLIVAHLILALDAAYAEIAHIKGEPAPVSIRETLTKLTRVS